MKDMKDNKVNKVIKNNKVNKENTMKKIGSRIEVMHGKAIQTGGGLRKSDLKLNSSGGIVSVRASDAAKKTNNLVGAGYVVEKGKFGSKYIGKGGDGKVDESQPENEIVKKPIKPIKPQKPIKPKKPIKAKPKKKLTGGEPITFF